MRKLIQISLVAVLVLALTLGMLAFFSGPGGTVNACSAGNWDGGAACILAWKPGHKPPHGPPGVQPLVGWNG
jgi:hypothetical protein